MLRFDPPELETKWEEATTVLEEVAELQPFEAEDDEDVIISERTEIEEFSMWSWDQTMTVTVADCLRWAALIKDKKRVLQDKRVLRLPTRTVVRIEPATAEDMSALHSIVDKVTTELNVEGRKFCVKAIDRCLDFSALVESECHEHQSSLDGMFFVEVQHDAAAPPATVDRLVEAFLFELCASEIFCAPREFYAIELYEEDDHDGFDKRGLKLRRLQIGKGLSELYSLFIEGCSAHPAEYALIHFVKAMEYVSATVVRRTKHEAIRKRLSSKRALAPDAEFLDGLVQVVEEYKLLNKDSEMLKLTLQTCCDPYLLACDGSPRFLPTLQSLRSCNEPKLHNKALEELASSLSATRNQLVHAKANYSPTGNECPRDQLMEFVVLARAASEQVIRWYANLADHIRVGG